MSNWLPSYSLTSATGSMPNGYQVFIITISAGSNAAWELPDVSGGQATDYTIWLIDPKGVLSIDDDGLRITDPNGYTINGLSEVKLGHWQGIWKFTFINFRWVMEMSDYRNEIRLDETFTSEAISGIQISDEHFQDVTGFKDYTSYRLKALVPIFPDTPTNVYVIYIGTIINPDSGLVLPHTTRGTVIADDNTFDQVFTSFTSRAIVTDVFTGNGSEGDAFFVILDDTGTAGVYDVYILAAAAFDFTCFCSIDFEFLTVYGDRIAFYN